MAKSPRSIDYWWEGFASRIGIYSSPIHDRLYVRDGDSYLTALVLLAPPLLSVAWYAVWRLRNPDAARLAKIRRSRAAAVALQMLAQAGDDSARQARHAIEEFLRARLGLHQVPTTRPEIAAYWHDSSHPRLNVDDIVSMLRRCDAARFAPAPADADGLVAEAKSLILKWDERS